MAEVDPAIVTGENPVVIGDDAAPDVVAAANEAGVKKTCVVRMTDGEKPTVNGDYVMFADDKYTVFNLPADVAMLDNVAAGAKFFKVLPDETKGGKRNSRKSAKKQRKSAKKQHKSAKKQRKSRGSRRSKK